MDEESEKYLGSIVEDEESEKQMASIVEDVPVMLFYEEPEHLRLLIRTKDGIVTRYLSKYNATQMMKWIGTKGTATNSEILYQGSPNIQTMYW
jgi:hypothetical protein